MSSSVQNIAVTARVRIPTPIYNRVSINIEVPDTETHAIKITDSTNGGYKTISPGADISIDVGNGESFFWESDDGTSTSNVVLLGTGF